MLCSIVGFVYPAFKSFETIETQTKGDDIQWLVYWVVFAFFSLIETFRDFLLYWIPFYYAFKLAFLLWAMLPQSKGAKFLYDSFLKDFLKKNESRIDAAMAKSKKVCDVVSVWIEVRKKGFLFYYVFDGFHGSQHSASLRSFTFCSRRK